MTMKINMAKTGIALMVSIALPAQAAVITDSTWSASWYGDSGIESVSGRSDSGSTFSVPLPGASTLQGTSSISVDASKGQVKSNTVLELHQVGDVSHISFSSSNLVGIDDQLSIDQDGFINIIVRTDGAFTHDMEIGDSPGSWAPVETVSDVQSSINTSVGATGADSQQQANFIEGWPAATGSEMSLYDNQDVSFEYSVLIPFDSLGGPVDFAFTYVEQAELYTYSFDAGFLDALVDNNFGSTMTLYGEVYDTEMNLLPDAVIHSTTGFTYQPAVVPVPAAVWLFGSGLIGLIGVARRRTSA